MIRIEYKSINNYNYVETKWVEETDTSSAYLGRLLLPTVVFSWLKEIIEKGFIRNIFRFEEKESK